MAAQFLFAIFRIGRLLKVFGIGKKKSAPLKIKGEFRLEWNGRQVSERVKQATEEALRELLEECVQRARSDHGWQSRTGTAEMSIQVGEIVRDSKGIRGQWGSYGGEAAYFVFLETGSSTIAADDTLRRAGDALYPELARRIRAKLGG